MAFGLACGVRWQRFRCADRGSTEPNDPWRQRCGHLERTTNMGYGIGGILLTILVILAIIYFAKRV
jgi:hypothetical protein